MRLSEKVVVIVPGTFGIGHDAAIRFASEGARVVLGGMDPENGRKTNEAVARTGGPLACFVPCDILKEPDVERLIGAALERHGRLDAVFGCPDYYSPGLLADQSASDLDTSLEYNCRSLFFIAKHAMPLMAKRGGGSLVFLTSMYGLVSGSSSAAYEVSKGVVVNMTRAFAERFAKARVRVNCIAAGHVAEPPRDLKDELRKSYMVRDEKEVDRLARFYPMGRIALGDEVARAAAFLASDDAAFVTGTTLSVDGGFVSR